MSNLSTATLYQTLRNYAGQTELAEAKTTIRSLPQFYPGGLLRKALRVFLRKPEVVTMLCDAVGSMCEGSHTAGVFGGLTPDEWYAIMASIRGTKIMGQRTALATLALKTNTARYDTDFPFCGTIHAFVASIQKIIAASDDNAGSRFCNEIWSTNTSDGVDGAARASAIRALLLTTLREVWAESPEGTALTTCGCGVCLPAREFIRAAYDSERLYCPTCATTMSTCASCDCEVPTASGTRLVVTGQFYCSSCATRYIGMCACCGVVGRRDHMPVVGHNPSSVRAAPRVCSTCYEDVKKVTPCTFCGTTWIRSDLSTMGMCPTCLSPAPPQRRGHVDSYHGTKARFRPLIGKSESGFSLRPGKSGFCVPRLFGFELEIEAVRLPATPSVIRDAVADQLGRLFAGGESDASLRTGVECISHPASIDVHREVLSGLGLLGVKGAASHDTTTCGLHVHVTRESMSELTICKLVALLTRRADESLWSRFFRRDLGHYCQAQHVAKISDGRRAVQGHYDVVNVSNRNTVELRWARGSLVAATVLATVEMLHVAIRFCETHATSDLTFAGLKDWIVSNPWARAESRYVREYMTTCGLLPLPKASPDEVALRDELTDMRSTSLRATATAAQSCFLVETTMSPLEGLLASLRKQYAEALPQYVTRRRTRHDPSPADVRMWLGNLETEIQRVTEEVAALNHDLTVRRSKHALLLAQSETLTTTEA